ncbi:MAG: FprA family A-type flavoprotein [Tannerella sp.]|jgi:flavorubredoxin|nr:FprA family A-type flavoprotein [Tannerella sp.]
MKKIANDIYYVGVNDRRKNLFENLWELPKGVSYNSYLIVGERTALIDTVDIAFSDIFLRKVEEALQGRRLDYLVVNHLEPDHSGNIDQLRRVYPEVQIVGNKQTFRMMESSHHIAGGLYEVKEGDTLDLGTHRLTFYMAPMVHWPEVMVAHDEADGILFSADAFGMYGALDGNITDEHIQPDWDEMIRYYANIVGKYGNPVQKLLQKLAGADIRMICSTHGPVWRSKREQAVAIYDRMSRYEGATGVTLAFGSMYGFTEQMAEAVAESLADNGIADIAMHDVSKSQSSYVLRDIFKYRGLIIGSPTYSGQLFPEIASLLQKIEVREVKNRLFGYFGAFMWSGAAVRLLTAFAETMKWKVVGEPFEERPSMNADKLARCVALGKAMAEELRIEN